MTTGLLLVGHGSRDPLTRTEHDELEARMRALFPDWRVESGFIELSDPPLSVALTHLAHACDRVVVAPLLLFSGGHMQRDLPRAVLEAQRVAPGTQFVIGEPVGLLAGVIDLAAERLRRCERDAVASVCVVVGRGASEVHAQQAFEQAVAQLASRCPHHQYAIAYCGVQVPTVLDALEIHARRGVAHVIVVPYLLFSGRLKHEIGRAIEQVRAEHPSMQIDLAGHLGPDATEAVAAQVRAALRVSLEPSVLPKS